jgi:GMP reductase
MRLDNSLYLDFQDVLLKPKRSTIKSRADINLVRTFKFLSGNTWTGIPIISSNMSSVTTPKVIDRMLSRNMLACVPKAAWNEKYSDPNIIRSIGLDDKLDYSEIKGFLCLDVPNGYIERVVDKVKEIRESFAGILMAGNVVTSEMVEALILAGADIIKCGIGSGAGCATRIKTGIGVPQLSAVIECADAAHGLGGHIISDGGCVVSGDVVKAFAAGSDFVMLGGMLSGHDENGTEFYGMSSERGNNEISGGLKEYRASEGWEFELPHRGPIDNTLQDITGGLRSACSYIGARSIKDLPKCSTFIQVNNQVNTSLWNYRVGEKNG